MRPEVCRRVLAMDDHELTLELMDVIHRGGRSRIGVPNTTLLSEHFGVDVPVSGSDIGMFRGNVRKALMNACGNPACPLTARWRQGTGVAQ